jgi:hypothetical protein
MYFILLNDWHVARREKQDTDAEIWRIILDIDDLEEWGDARIMVMLVMMMVMMRFQNDSDDNDNNNNNTEFKVQESVHRNNNVKKKKKDAKLDTLFYL